MSPSNFLAPPPAGKVDPGDLVDDKEAAAILGTSAKTMRNWRSLRKGPTYRKIGARLVRYHRADLIAYQKIVAGDAEDLT